MPPLLSVEGLTKRFGGLAALTDVSFQVAEHEVLGVIGPNGAGKSTLLNVISGVYQPTRGRVVFADTDLTGHKPHDVARAGIGHTFQSSLLFHQLPVVDNVFIASHLHYQSPTWQRVLRLPTAKREEAALRQRAEEVLERVGLGPLKLELTKNLPHGHQRILGVAIALCTRPRVLLLDEPFTGMNRNETQTMMGLIRGVREDGVTIVLIEHNMEAMMALADRLVVLDHGIKLAEGLPDEIRANARVIEAYLGRGTELVARD
jgi:branched-chain amino acid transport system ATP-binding protein